MVTLKESIMCKSTHLYFKVVLSWAEKGGDIWTYGIIIDVPEPNVYERCCYIIKLSSGRIITRNSIHVCQTHVPAKTFLTDTDKQTETNNIHTYSPVSPLPLLHDLKPIKQDTSS